MLWSHFKDSFWQSFIYSNFEFCRFSGFLKPKHHLDTQETLTFFSNLFNQKKQFVGFSTANEWKC